MKALRTLPIALACLFSTVLDAQNVAISFTATADGTHIALDSILVQNLTQGGDTMLYAPDTVLVLDFSTAVIDPQLGAISGMTMHPPIPNPFDGSARFSVSVEGSGELFFSIYDAMGKLLAADRRVVGKGIQSFDYSGATQGVVFAIAEWNGQRALQRAVCLSAQGETTGLRYVGQTAGAPGLLRPKSGTLVWTAGDSLRYTGYMMLAPTPLGMDSASAAGVPIGSETVALQLTTLSDSLSAEQIDFLDALPDTVIPPQNIIIEDTITAFDVLQELDPSFIDSMGFMSQQSEERDLLSATQQKQLLLSRMSAFGWFLVSDNNHVHDYEGPNSPAQYGLAYGYGSKFYHRRRRPTGGDCTSDLLYALDCSGMIYNMGHFSKLRFPKQIRLSDVEAMTDLSYWRKALEQEYDKLSVEDKGLLALDSIRSGDIILWNKHVGQVFFTGPAGYQIFQSNGTPNANRNCAGNLEQGRGPSMKPLNIYWLTVPFGPIYRVYRFVEKGCGGQTTVTDIDGHVYPVVSIGNQCWMSESLRTTRYRDGSIIENVTISSVWGGLTSGAWCNYNNDAANDLIYGKLYNWHAVNSEQGLCPYGWHVPSKLEFQELADFLGGNSIAGGKLKSESNLWLSPNTGATNETGFSGLPGGLIFDGYTPLFTSLGYQGMLWSSTENNALTSWSQTLSYNSSGTGPYTGHKIRGLCVRCLKD